MNQNKIAIVLLPGINPVGSMVLFECIKTAFENVHPVFNVPFRYLRSPKGIRDFTINELVEELEQYLSDLKNKGFTDFILVGKSFGGLVATLHQKKYNRAKKLFLLAPPIYLSEESTAKISDTKLSEFQNLKQITFNQDVITSLDMPVVLFQGTADKTVDCENSKKLSQCSDRIILRIVEDADHNFTGKEDVIVGAIKNITKTMIFDLGGVFFEADWDGINKYILEKTGVPILPSDGTRYDFYVDFALGKISSNEYFVKLLKAVNSEIDVGVLENAYKEAYIKNTKIDERMLALAKKLHKKYKLICVTNTNEFHKKINKIRGLFTEFDEVFSSFELGKIKNESDMFVEILDKLNLNPADCIFIDDKVGNVASAKSIGIDAIHFTNYESLVSELQNRGVLW
jgi:putative hydrolase of the HAD superfamily